MQEKVEVVLRSQGVSGDFSEVEFYIDEDRICSLKELMEACRSLIDSGDCTGCTPDLVVIESIPYFDLKRMLRNLKQ